MLQHDKTRNVLLMEGSEVHWQGRPHLGLVPMEHSWKEEFTHIAADGTRLRLLKPVLLVLFTVL